MKGCARAEKKAFELSVSQAWHGEAFARQKQLGPLSDYLPREARRPQTADEMLAILRSFPAGAGMTIEQIN